MINNILIVDRDKYDRLTNKTNIIDVITYLVIKEEKNYTVLYNVPGSRTGSGDIRFNITEEQLMEMAKDWKVK